MKIEIYFVFLCTGQFNADAEPVAGPFCTQEAAEHAFSQLEVPADSGAYLHVGSVELPTIDGITWY